MSLVGVFLVVGFLVGWLVRSPRSVRASYDRTLLVSVSHLLEDAESALNSLEGEGVHRANPLLFARVKGKVALAQTMVRNLLGLEQRFGRGHDVTAQAGGKVVVTGLDFSGSGHDPF